MNRALRFRLFPRPVSRPLTRGKKSSWQKGGNWWFLATFIIRSYLQEKLVKVRRRFGWGMVRADITDVASCAVSANVKHEAAKIKGSPERKIMFKWLRSAKVTWSQNPDKQLKYTSFWKIAVLTWVLGKRWRLHLPRCHKCLLGDWRLPH